MTITTNPPALPAGFSFRPLTVDDATAVADLVRTDELAVFGESFLDVADVLGGWARPSFRLGTDAIGVVDGAQRLVAFGELSRPERAEGVVDAAVRGRGIGSAVLTWIERRAAVAGSELIGQTVPASHATAVPLLRSRGYAPRWTTWVLQLPAGAQIAAPALPVGWSIRDFQPDRDGPATYRVVEEAFAEWPDRPPVAFQDWAAFTLGRPGFESWQLQLAISPDGTDGAVAGVVALAVTGDGQGWIEQLAVARVHRGRGLGRALLATGFAATRANGATTAMLSTDSRTGALDLYRHVGMVVSAEFTHLARQLSATGPGR